MPVAKLSHRMKKYQETVDIHRQDLENSRNTNEIVSSIKIIIFPTRQRNTVLPTGEVIQNPDFRGVLLVPNSSIEEGDIVVREGNPKLFIHRIMEIDGYQQLQLDETTR